MPDYTLEDTVYKRFTTRAFATGIPTVLAGTPVVSAYEDDSVTQITAGITLGVDHDSVVGLNLLTIVATAANGYEAGKSYDLVITAGTVDSVSVVGEVVWHFTLGAEAAITQIGTAGAGLTAIDLPNQTMDITGNLSGSVGSVAADGITASSIATDAIGAAELAADAVAEIADGVWDEDIEAAHGTDATAGWLLRILGKAISDRTRNANLYDTIRDVISVVESQRGMHTHQAIGNIYYVDPTNGATHASGNRGGISDPYASIQDAHDSAVTDSNHDMIIFLAGAAAGPTTHTEDITISKRYLFLRGPGRDAILVAATNTDTITITADGFEISGFQINTTGAGSGNGIDATDADFLRVHNCWVNNTRGDGIHLLRCDNAVIRHNSFLDTGQTGAGHGIDIVGTAGTSNDIVISDNLFKDVAGDGIQISGGTTNRTVIQRNSIYGATSWGIDVGASSTGAVITDNRLGNNTSGDIQDNGTNTLNLNNIDREQIKAETALIVADTNELQTDWTDAGRLDTILDSILTDTAEIGAAGVGLTEVSLTSAEKDAIADHTLRRTVANARASADGDAVVFRSLLGAISKLVNRIDTTTTPGRLTVMEEDDATTFGEQALTTDATADPVTVADTV